MSKKILYFVESCGFTGGIERFAFQSAEALRRAGYRTDCCFIRPGREFERFGSGFDRIFPLAQLLEKTADYDLAVLHKLPELPLLREIESRFGRKLVFWAHDHDLYCPGHHLYLPLCRINCSRIHHPLRCACCALPGRLRGSRNILKEVKTLLTEPREKLRLLSGHPAVVLSDFMRSNLLKNGFRADRVRVIPPFARPTERMRPFMPHDRLRLLFLGQLIRGKGCDLLLRALPLLEIPYELRIAGDGNDRKRLEKLAGSLRLGDRVRFIGWQSEPERCLAETDLVIMPSRWQEPFGLSGLEAAAYGVPTVAFDIGGIGEWLKDGVNGIVVPAGNIKALAGGIAHAGALRFRLEQMGSAGIELIRKQFSEENFLAGMTALMEDATV